MWGFLIVCIVFVFVFAVVKTALVHAENIERIRHGYPTLDADKAREFPDADLAFKSEDGDRGKMQ